MKPAGFIFIMVVAGVLLAFTTGMLVHIVRLKVKHLPDQELLIKPLLAGVGLLAVGIALLFTAGKMFRYFVQFAIALPAGRLIEQGIKKHKIAQAVAINCAVIFFAAIVLGIFVGFPNPKPVVMLEETALIVDETKISDLLADGFTIYIRDDEKIIHHEDLYREEILERYTPYTAEDEHILFPQEYAYSMSDTRSRFYIAKDGYIYGSIAPRIPRAMDLKDAIIKEYRLYPTTYGQDVLPSDPVFRKINIRLDGQDIFDMGKNDFATLYKKTETFSAQTEWPDYMITRLDSNVASIRAFKYEYLVRFRFNPQYEKEEYLLQVVSLG